MSAPAREQLADVESVTEERHGEAAADLHGSVPDAEAHPGEGTASAAAGAPVSRIIGIVNRGEEIGIIAQGPIDNFDSFTLAEPLRIVVDFWGARNGVRSAKHVSDVGPVAQIRIREHLDKVRVILALRAEILSHRIQVTATGVKIVLDVSAATAERTESRRTLAGFPTSTP